jgi:hypothetical protein
MYLSQGFSTDVAAQTIVADFDRETTSASKFLEQLSEHRYLMAERLFSSLVKRL